jgi:hypothetical protein
VLCAPCSVLSSERDERKAKERGLPNPEPVFLSTPSLAPPCRTIASVAAAALQNAGNYPYPPVPMPPSRNCPGFVPTNKRVGNSSQLTNSKRNDPRPYPTQMVNTSVASYVTRRMMCSCSGALLAACEARVFLPISTLLYTGAELNITGGT